MTYLLLEGAHLACRPVVLHGLTAPFPFLFWHVDSQPIQISVAGAGVKNISVSQVGEVRDVGCTVDSCRSDQYMVRFLYPNGTVAREHTSTAMMMTFNLQVTITSEIVNSNFTCQVLLGGIVTDSAVFQFAGECVSKSSV